MTLTVQVTGYFSAPSLLWAKISALRVLGTLPIALATTQHHLVRGTVEG